MPTYRVHYRPRQIRVLEDVQADEISHDRGGGLTLWGWVLIIGYPRRVVALRVRHAAVDHVEDLCAARGTAAAEQPRPAPPPHAATATP